MTLGKMKACPQPEPLHQLDQLASGVEETCVQCDAEGREFCVVRSLGRTIAANRGPLEKCSVNVQREECGNGNLQFQISQQTPSASIGITEGGENLA